MTEEERKREQRCKREDILDYWQFKREGKVELYESIKEHLKIEHATDI